MNYSDNIEQNDSGSHSTRVFLLGMATAFIISLSISHASSGKIIANSTQTDCDNPVSVSHAQDRSRNGIATAC